MGPGRLLHHALRLPGRPHLVSGLLGAPADRGLTTRQHETGGASRRTPRPFPELVRQRSDCGVCVATAASMASLRAANVVVAVSWTCPFALVTEMTRVCAGSVVGSVVGRPSHQRKV